MPARNEEDRQIRSRKVQWEEANQQFFGRERKKEFSTEDGIPIGRLYTPLDLLDQKYDYVNSLGFPGEYPFTRGINPTGYRERIWACGQYAGSSSVEESNRLFKDLIAGGNEQVHVAFDTPSKQGYDSDDPFVKGEVGKTGTAWDSLEDAEILFDGIDLANTEVTYIYVPFAIFALGQHIVVGKKQGYSPEQLRLVLQNDILQGYSANNQYIAAPIHGMRLAIDAASYVARNMPKAFAFQLCTYHLGEAGANKDKQIAITISSAMAYIEEVLKRGVDIDLIAPKIKVLGYVTHRDFFAEIAKIRAMRRMWAEIMKDHFRAKDKNSWKMSMHIVGGGVHMTKDLEMNMGRTAIASLCAALAGPESIGGATYDEPWGIPSKKAKMDTIRMNYLVSDETGVMDVIDPLGGSYYVESLTSALESSAWKYMERINDMGGMVKGVTSGSIQRDIALDMLRQQKQIDKKEKIMIGLNKFIPQNKEKTDYYKPNPRVLQNQTEKLKRIRANRNNGEVQKCLDKIRKFAARDDGEDSNLVIPIVEAIKAYVTCGEICKALKDVFGPWRGPMVW